MDRKDLLNHYANTEIKHIQLELQAGRSMHMRHFIDPYFCYRNGYINSKGGAKTEAIKWNEYISENLLGYYGSKDKRVTMEKEHVVPIKVVTEKLVNLGPNPSLKEIENILDDHLYYANITREEEHQIDKELKLKSSMPESYYDPSHQLYGNKFARYIEAGIELYRQFNTPNESVFGKMNLYEVNPCPVGSYYWPEDLWKSLEERLNNSVYPTLQKIDSFLTTSEFVQRPEIKYNLHLEKWHKELILDELFQVVLKYCEINLDRGVLAEIWVNEEVNNRFYLNIESELWYDKTSDEEYDVWHISFSKHSKYCLAEKMTDTDINKAATQVFQKLKSGE